MGKLRCAEAAADTPQPQAEQESGSGLKVTADPFESHAQSLISSDSADKVRKIKYTPSQEQQPDTLVDSAFQEQGQSIRKKAYGKRREKKEKKGVVNTCESVEGIAESLSSHVVIAGFVAATPGAIHCKNRQGGSQNLDKSEHDIPGKAEYG